MRERLSIETVDPRDAEGMARVNAFAASFGHDVKAPGQAVYLLKRGERPIGFFQAMQMIVASPNWHTDPAVCSPRDILEGGNLMSEACKFATGSCIMEVPLENTPFTPEVMAKVGFVSRETRLYQKT